MIEGWRWCRPFFFQRLMATTLQGIITEITFQNEDNGYTVLKLQDEQSLQPVPCVGTMPTVVPGETVLLTGDWDLHRRYGRQFLVERYEMVRPTTIHGITQLLGSGFIVNIGPVRAAMIVERFGLATLDVLDTEPDRLLEVRGIGRKTLGKIREAWDRQRHIRDLMLYLQGIGVSLNLATRIYKAYGERAREKISSDPYALLDDVWGVGFIKADTLARNMGFRHDSYKRIRAGITYVLSDAASSGGHTYVPADELVTKASALLEVEQEQVVYSLDHAISAHLLVREESRVYLPAFFSAEKKVADLLRARMQAGVKVCAQRNRLAAWLDRYEQTAGWRCDPVQREAIIAGVEQSLFLLTGGPGTGKTTILQVLVEYMRQQHRTVELAAPTGRAAARMGNVAGIPARTIHRLLEFKGGGGEQGYRFLKNEKNPVDADVVIVDECSMIDLMLMSALLRAIKPGTSLIFVGDNNQLPSVGAGSVLADMIRCGLIPHVHLTTIFRQAASSRIVTAAHEIIEGKVPFFSNTETDNCFFVTREDPEECVDTIIDLVARRLPSRYGFNPVSDIQVLSPMHKGPVGTQNLTTILQKTLASSDVAIAHGTSLFYCGDKVLQLRNNYDRGVFNGDIGIVVSIDAETGMTVDFEGTIVPYGRRDLDELAPAYCMSVHKSQGCEFKAVVLPLVNQHYIMLQRNLIYTALTRARKLCVLVGTRRALAIAVRNSQAHVRHSALVQRLSADVSNSFYTIARK
ncbi:MAG: ATP-dependent RecD-like DNA helicase [Chitinispirillaceae bacterium]|nr:ATP-dependent RecD-like DNA helicase [Chitinispirillaceae bacterium]